MTAQAILLQRDFRPSGALEWAWTPSPATLSSHASDSGGLCTAHGSTRQKANGQQVKTSVDFSLSRSFLKVALADLPAEKMDSRRLEWVREKKTPQVMWILERVRRLYDQKVKRMQSGVNIASKDALNWASLTFRQQIRWSVALLQVFHHRLVPPCCFYQFSILDSTSLRSS